MGREGDKVIRENIFSKAEICENKHCTVFQEYFGNSKKLLMKIFALTALKVRNFYFLRE